MTCEGQEESMKKAVVVARRRAVAFAVQTVLQEEICVVEGERGTLANIHIKTLLRAIFRK